MPQDLIPALQIHRDDTVAIALRSLAAGEVILGVQLNAPIERGHKLALQAHRSGDPVIKYGLPIGKATAPIAPGEAVHVHNLRTALGGELAYTRNGAAAAPPSLATQSWHGYRRADGRAATRNEVWILPTVGCVAVTAEEIARQAQGRHGARIDGIHAFAHPHGCQHRDKNGPGTGLKRGQLG